MRACAHVPLGRSDPSLANRQRLLGWLFQTIATINGALHARGQAEPALAGMGSTLDMALVRGQSVFLAHVGDSTGSPMITP